MSHDKGKDLNEKIFFASKVMVNILAEALINAGAQGLSAPQYRVLDMILSGVDKPSELARMLDTSPPAVSWLLMRLEEGGFLERGHIKEDRRRVVLELTDKGRETVREVNSRRKRMIGAVLKNMNARDVDRLETSLDAFAESYLSIKGAGSTLGGDRDG